MPINEKEVINELNSIIAYCDLLKEKVEVGVGRPS